MYWDDEMHVAVIRHNRGWWQREALRAAITIGTAVVVLVWTDSMVITVFYALAMGYALNTLLAFRYGDGFWARASVAACAIAAALITLFFTIEAWGRAWASAALALAVGGATHLIAGRLLAPGFIRRQQAEREREWRLDSGSHAAWNGWRRRHPHPHV